ncbi:ABC transporter ATP-binding protein [Saxibacter everestensis]|uniref:ABC transporter ATP-binding protein n=1 Tax=Saxibacter everestensis TaxID=2909229 RepID=A0ABY8QRR3_9MICO|nr:ABC transporter ATP-binding protein [Brevibacteriaceae bacterium ZFBP1038]
MTNQLPAPLLDVANLSVSYHGRYESTRVVHDVAFSVQPGEVVAVVGESGSGKTTTAQAIIGLLADNGRTDSGSIALDGTDIAGWSSRRLEAIRGTRVGLIPQDPNNSLNPVKRIGESLAEVLRIHKWGDRKQVQARVIELLERVGIPEPHERARQYPHQLSGGMKQRVLIASAVALQPALIIADEPTSALDVTVQRRILDLLDDLRRESGTALLFVTHDLAVAAERANRIIVMKDGRIQEQNVAAEILNRPQSEYTRTLIDDVPSFAVGSPARDVGPVTAAGPVAAADTAAKAPPAAVTVTNLVQEFSRGRKDQPFRAVDNVSFSVASGTTHAIVGESGSGKTTLARAVLGFQRATSGSIQVGGHDVLSLRGESLRSFRRVAQLVYQNPFSSLDPRQSIDRIIAEPLVNFRIGSKRERAAKVAEFIDRVALPSGIAARHPRELSGGQRQRVAIARALIVEPEVVVLDEAVSALDVTVQAQILQLLEMLQVEFGLTYLFISHDLAVVRQISDTVSVMRAGRAEEHGATAEIFDRPRSEYTKELLAAIPGRGITLNAAAIS